MDADDVAVHRASRHLKIQDEEQLAAIATPGFRGRGHPSIASVSWMTILSRPHNQDLGARAEIRYGVLQAMHEDGCARGTVIEVRHLFGNMPARKNSSSPLAPRSTTSKKWSKIRPWPIPAPGLPCTRSPGGPEYRPDATLEQRVREVFRYSGGLLALAPEGGRRAGGS